MKTLLFTLPAIIAYGATAASQTLVSSAGRGDRELGHYLSSECVTCHQSSGRQSGGVPSISGWPSDQFVAVMHSYKNKDRDNEVMRTIAARLSDEEIQALAAYFEELKQHP